MAEIKEIVRVVKIHKPRHGKVAIDWEMSEKMKKALDELAEKRGITIDELIEEAIRQHNKRMEGAKLHGQGKSLVDS